jgi:hypothetical protein
MSGSEFPSFRVFFDGKEMPVTGFELRHEPDYTSQVNTPQVNPFTAIAPIRTTFTIQGVWLPDGIQHPTSEGQIIDGLREIEEECQ